MNHENNGRTTGKRGGCTGQGFLPGRSGNVNGRPQTAHFGESVREFLHETDSHGKERLRRILERLEKDKPELLLAYGFGKPRETLELSAVQPADGGMVVIAWPHEIRKMPPLPPSLDGKSVMVIGGVTEAEMPQPKRPDAEPETTPNQHGQTLADFGEYRRTC